ncbi:peptidase domain-containing ABC transporter [Bacillus sp. YAF12_1]|uniref:peptidase domain-containing ABC transporter n=1 Tax=Bacillus TaxID=1386 RepID=UPI000B450565|nr:peptidase domain-containing ABC transporter [Bacillus thuringiensis]OTW79065.1 hypothetical protein BK713_20235 [Bacillus thuringiensis serovar jinghongiensis]
MVKKILQQDSRDCGPACLAIICRHYGLKKSISFIRSIAGTDRMGTSGYGMLKAAKELNFNTKGLFIKDKNQVTDLQFYPFIAHLEPLKGMNHYVVINKIKNNKVYISDPQVGLRILSLTQFNELWTGYVLLLEPDANFKNQKDDNSIFSLFFELIVGEKKILFLIFLFSIISTTLAIVNSFYFKYLVDKILPLNQVNNLRFLSLGIISAVVGKAIIDFSRQYMIFIFSKRIDIPLMSKVYNHVTNLPMNFFSNRRVGEVISRYQDASVIRDALSSAAIGFMMDTILLISGGIVLYQLNSSLFYVSLIPIILYIVCIISFKKVLEVKNRDTLISESEVNGYLVETLNGIEYVKSFNIENSVIADLKIKYRDYINKVTKFAATASLQITIQQCIKGVFTIIILWIGALKVIDHQISLGTLITFNSLLIYFFSPIESLLGLQPKIQSALVAGDRLKEMLDLEIDKINENSLQSLNTIKYIEVKNVDFRYGSRDLVLSNVSFKIKSGEKVAFVGESGSGKTTIAKLLLNYYSIEKGNILISGKPINNLKKTDLRNQIVYMSQENFFFSGTIKENLKMANNDITDEEIIEVCKKVALENVIEKLPHKYDTYLEEKGANLSSGQRQRLAIARCLLKKPSIFILDEATSNLDSITAKKINDLLDNLDDSITTINITHSLRFVTNCSKVFVMKNGCIIGEGDHQSLLKTNSYYTELWREQNYL